MSSERARLTFVNAQLGSGTSSSLRTTGTRIGGIDDDACVDNLIVDLHGDRLLPGLINAHDHLHLNTLPPLQTTAHWRHAREWATEVTLRRRTDPVFGSHLAVALEERLLIGGVKNLLAGVTTVAHHDPVYPSLLDDSFPVRVVTDFGWSHSLYVDGEEQVRRAYLRTPQHWPWIIHLAEGVDEEAASEFDQLVRLGCLGANTLAVHGIAFDEAARTRLESASAGLIWCPSSNARLFGRTAEVSDLASRGRVALGTDSRFSGSRDLLCELRTAREAAALEESVLESMVTRDAAALLRLNDRGTLRVGQRADFLVLPAGLALFDASRSDIRLVVSGGRPLYADPEYAHLVASPNHWASVLVDGRPKMLERRLVAALSVAAVSEPGLEIPDLTWAAA
jgi:cytosine/adenosine deaminase-related metal-dependent hydrolase